MRKQWQVIIGHRIHYNIIWHIDIFYSFLHLSSFRLVSFRGFSNFDIAMTSRERSGVSSHQKSFFDQQQSSKRRITGITKLGRLSLPGCMHRMTPTLSWQSIIIPFSPYWAWRPAPCNSCKWYWWQRELTPPWRWRHKIAPASVMAYHCSRGFYGIIFWKKIQDGVCTFMCNLSEMSRLSRFGIIHYIPHYILWYVITHPCPRYLYAPHRSSKHPVARQFIGP